MRFAAGLFAFVLKLGGLGLLVLGILDSSFLFARWGNDLLVVAMTVRHPDGEHMLYYAAMSTVGSVLGCLPIDVVLRPLGAQGLEKHLSAGRLKRVERKVRDNAGQALAIASLIPPPFPFTAFVMAAAALQYPRQRLLAVLGATRMVRFTLLGVLALHFGESILTWSRNPIVQGFLVVLIILCTVGSVLSVYWMDPPEQAVVRAAEESKEGHARTPSPIGIKSATSANHKESISMHEHKIFLRAGWLMRYYPSAESCAWGTSCPRRRGAHSRWTKMRSASSWMSTRRRWRARLASTRTSGPIWPILRGDRKCTGTTARLLTGKSMKHRRPSVAAVGCNYA